MRSKKLEDRGFRTISTRRNARQGRQSMQVRDASARGQHNLQIRFLISGVLISLLLFKKWYKLWNRILEGQTLLLIIISPTFGLHCTLRFKIMFNQDFGFVFHSIIANQVLYCFSLFTAVIFLIKLLLLILALVSNFLSKI